MEEEPYHSMAQSQKHSFNAPKKEKYKHLIAFVNTKSGGQQGQKVLKRLKKHLPNEQIIDLIEGPQKGFDQIELKKIENPIIVACGGDGTICWLLSTMDKMGLPPEKYLPIAIIPLGTGNDLARVMRFGGGFSSDNLEPLLEKIIDGEPVPLDRWSLKIFKKEEFNPPPPRPGAPPPLRAPKKSRVYGHSEPTHKTYNPYGPLSKTYNEIPSSLKAAEMNIQDKPEPPHTAGNKKKSKKKTQKEELG